MSLNEVYEQNINRIVTITISPSINENVLGKVTVNISFDQLVILSEKSEYLQEIVTTVDTANQDKNLELFLLESEPCNALSFMHELIMPSDFLSSNYWRKDWVELSTKWIVNRYVQHFKEIAKQIIDSTLITSFRMNLKSIYDESDVDITFISKDLYTYTGKDGNYNYVMMYSNAWLFQKSIHCGKGVHGIDKCFYMSGDKISNISLEAKNVTYNVNIFCHVVSVVLKHPCLMHEESLIKSKKDLIFAIIKTPILRCQVVYDSLLDNEDFVELALAQLG